MARSYFSYSVVRADSSNLTTGGDAILTSLKDVNWSVKLVDENGDESVTAIYTGITGPTTIAGAGGTTGYNGLIEFWADAGQYVIKITDPEARIADKNIYWDSVSGQAGGIPGDFISSESIESGQIKDSEVSTSDLASSAVTTAKIASSAVTTEKLNDLSVTNAKIANTTIERTKLITEVQNSLVPLGAIIDWFPPKSATGPDWSVPAGFAVCSGAAWTVVPNDLGYGSGDGNMPDLVGKVTYGAQTSAIKGTAGTFTTSNGTFTSPGVGGTLGSNTSPNLRHQHSVDAHAHGMNHAHGASLPVKSGFGQLQDTDNNALVLDQNAGTVIITGGPIVSAYDGTPKTSTDNGGGGNTGFWSSAAGNADYYLQTRPEGVGVLKIMKVRNV